MCKAAKAGTTATVEVPKAVDQVIAARTRSIISQARGNTRLLIRSIYYQGLSDGLSLAHPRIRRSTIQQLEILTSGLLSRLRNGNGNGNGNRFAKAV